MKTEKIKVIICNKGWWEKNYFHIPKENMKELTKEEIEDLKELLRINTRELMKIHPKSDKEFMNGMKFQLNLLKKLEGI